MLNNKHNATINSNLSGFDQQQQQHNQHSKLATMINLASKPVSVSKIGPININIPQSMTVFNLKEISFKFKNFKTINNLKEMSTKVQFPPPPLPPPKLVSSPSNSVTASSILSVISKNGTSESASLDETKTETLSSSSPPIMLKAPPVLVVQAPVSSANKLMTLSSQTLPPSSTTAAVSQLPYHYSDFENLYVCNLCNFTYDSLRSIKAHIWKHSGHHDLSYPILDLNNNNNNSNKTINSFSKKQINDSIATTSNNFLISKPSSNAITSTNNSNSSSSSIFNVNNNTNNSGNSGGICSVLLEVIEKLRDEESSSVTNTSHNKMAVESSIISDKTAQSKRKCKRSLKSGSLNCKRLIKKAKLKIRRHINNKKVKRKDLIRRLKQKRKTLPQIKSDAVALKKISEKEPIKECKIETSVLNSLFDDDATILNNKDIYETYDFYFKTLSRNSVSTSSPSSSSSLSSSSSSLSPKSYENSLKSNDINGVFNSDLFCLLSSLANNDGHDEQYVCGLCSYVCYHLPSLKSHMWSHVKSLQFDYSVNTSIINAALDYENKLNRKLNSIRKATMENFDMSGEKDTSNSLNRNIYMHRQLSNALELINYPQEQIEKLTAYQANKSSPMVSFRCSRCNFESIDLSVLRLHKREHIK